MGDHVREQQREEHADIGGVKAKKVFVFDDSGNQITSFGGDLSTSSGVTVYQGSTPWNSLGTSSLGAAIPAGEAYVGLATVDIGSAIPAGESFIGLATVNLGSGNDVDISGTTKSILDKPIAISAASITTLASITNTFYITNVLVNSNSTVRVNFKSGATYLTGNASIGITLSPNGGFVENGSVDSPLYQGVAAGGDIILEKWEDDGLVAEISGHITYYEE